MSPVIYLTILSETQLHFFKKKNLDFPVIKLKWICERIIVTCDSRFLGTK